MNPIQNLGKRIQSATLSTSRTSSRSKRQRTCTALRVLRTCESCPTFPPNPPAQPHTTQGDHTYESISYYFAIQSPEEKNRARIGRRGGTRCGVVAGHDPVDDLGGVDGVELVEEVERGEAPVGAVEADVLHHQRLERVLLLRRRQERALETGEDSRGRGAGWPRSLPSPRWRCSGRAGPRRAPPRPPWPPSAPLVLLLPEVTSYFADWIRLGWRGGSCLPLADLTVMCLTMRGAGAPGCSCKGPGSGRGAARLRRRRPPLAVRQAECVGRAGRCGCAGGWESGRGVGHAGAGR